MCKHVGGTLQSIRYLQVTGHKSNTFTERKFPYFLKVSLSIFWPLVCGCFSYSSLSRLSHLQTAVVVPLNKSVVLCNTSIRILQSRSLAIKHNFCVAASGLQEEFQHLLKAFPLATQKLFPLMGTNRALHVSPGPSAPSRASPPASSPSGTLAESFL